VGARFSAPEQTGPGAHPASCKMGTGSFPGVKSGRGVTLTTHPLLVSWSRKSRAIPLHFLLLSRRQTMYYKLKLRGVRATIVAVKNTKDYIFCVCVCSLRYPVCNTHASYCRLWPTRLYDIFPHYLINGTTFGWEKLCVLIFCTKFCCYTIFLSMKN